MSVRQRIRHIKNILTQLDKASKQWENLLNDSLTPTFRRRLEEIIRKDQQTIYHLRLQLYELESDLLEKQEETTRSGGRKSRSHDSKPKAATD